MFVCLFRLVSGVFYKCLLTLFTSYHKVVQLSLQSLSLFLVRCCSLMSFHRLVIWSAETRITLLCGIVILTLLNMGLLDAAKHFTSESPTVLQLRHTFLTFFKVGGLFEADSACSACSATAPFVAEFGFCSVLCC